MVTIKEMAQELGVSTTTVSNVIHGKTKEVSPANIERIQKILKKYDYTPISMQETLRVNDQRLSAF